MLCLTFFPYLNHCICCCFLQFLYDKILVMNNFGLYNPFYYQFWVMPNFVASRQPIYTPVAFCPQLTGPQESNLIIQTQIPNSNCSLQVQQPKTEQREQRKPNKEQPSQKSQPQKVTVQPDSSISKEFTNKKQPKKANRPQTYLTEKAYYMKQKLKSKQFNGNRILRRRLKAKQSKITKLEQRDKSYKKPREWTKTLMKRLPIAKDSQKQRKIVNKIKTKLAKEYNDQFARIPKLISGVSQLNRFCLQKIQNLMLRQMKEQ